MHEKTYLRASTLGRRARGLGGGPPALEGCLRPTPLPDPARQRQGRDLLHHRPDLRLPRPDRPKRHQALRGGRHRGGAHAGLAPPAHGSHGLPRRARRKVARAAPSESPRLRGKPTGLWTLELAAEASFEEGITEGRVAGETVRATLARMGVRWLRAKHWITSPDPQYARKKDGAIG